MNYILTADGEPAPCDSIIVWALWFESSGDERIVARDELSGGIVVSTVFLGIDHNFLSSGPPILFETMIFGGDFDQELRRYHTRAQATEGHARLVRELRGTLAGRVN